MAREKSASRRPGLGAAAARYAGLTSIGTTESFASGDQKWRASHKRHMSERRRPFATSVRKKLRVCGQALASFKQPHEVRLVDSLPRSTLEKVAKAELRALLVES